VVDEEDAASVSVYTRGGFQLSSDELTLSRFRHWRADATQRISPKNTYVELKTLTSGSC